jgi:hypothetical protein
MVVSISFCSCFICIKEHSSDFYIGKLERVRAHIKPQSKQEPLSNILRLVMVAENISLGILSLPSAVATLGIVP